jgi:hypothetical protein
MLPLAKISISKDIGEINVKKGSQSSHTAGEETATFVSKN